jgi:hypothetical protein
MGDVINLDDHRKPPETHTVFSLCCKCMARWAAHVEIGCALFKLECPNCGAHDSFPSFISAEYLEKLNQAKEGEQ